MSNLHALGRLTVKDAPPGHRHRIRFCAVFALLAAVLTVALAREPPPVGIRIIACSVAALPTLLSLVTLLQGVLGKRTELTGWILDQLVARGEVLAPQIESTPHGFPHQATIREAIHALYRHLSRRTLGKFSRSIPQSLADLDPNEDPVIAIQRLARAIAEHLGLPSGKIVVTFDPTLENSGQVELSNQDVYFIDLQARYRHERQWDIAAILGHEITHIFLFRGA